jgi:hypothetical protein
MRNGLIRTAVAAGLAAAILASSAEAAPTTRRRASMAARYIVSKQNPGGAFVVFSKVGSTADAVLSLVAAKRGPAAIDDAIEWLRKRTDDSEGAPNAIDNVGEKSKVVMALVAAGRNPRHFGGRNFVSEIRSGRDEDGSYGDQAFSKVFDQALALLALYAADAEVPSEATSWLVDAQCPDGGWQFDQPYNSESDDSHCFDSSAPSDFNTSDSNTTALAVQAFAQGPAVLLGGDPFEFFKTVRDPVKGGWVFAPQFVCEGEQLPPSCSVTDANSTALVIQAFVAADKEVPDRGDRALRHLQLALCGEDAGAFAYTWSAEGENLVKGSPDLGATIGAVPGIVHKPFPIETTDVTLAVPEAPAC